MKDLDIVDLRILDILQDNSRHTNKEIAEKMDGVGLRSFSHIPMAAVYGNNI